MNYQVSNAGPFFSSMAKLNELELNFSPTACFVNLIDLSAVQKIRAAAGDSAPSYTAIVSVALAKALMEFPLVNRRSYRTRFLRRARLQKFSQVDIAFAAETDISDEPYVTYNNVMREVEAKSAAEVSAWLRSIRSARTESEGWRFFERVFRRLPSFLGVRAAHSAVFKPEAWVKNRGGVAIISSPAKYGVDQLVTCWTYPIGISFGLVKERALVVDGQVVARPSVYLMMNFDRRNMAGALAAKFFNRLCEILERGEI